jgi:16S rRNA (guanine966-N2)-methyltransferase
MISSIMAAAKGNRVRIIGGRWASRLVRFPPAAQLRPTPDRVRETLFNWLGQRLDGLSCLDLFAGSGALGLEALARGASRAVMVEKDRAVAAALRQSSVLLQAGGAEIVVADAIAWLAKAADRFDVAFVDPPYASRLQEAAMRALGPVLKGGARVYVESDRPLAAPAGWQALREDRAGAVRYALYEVHP